MTVDGPTLTLTFDDGPDEHWTPRVLEELERLGAHACFFMTGERLCAAPWIARKVAGAGHEIGLHCDQHIRHTEMDESEIEADTVAALAAFAEVGLFPTRWRTPWGICTPATVRVAERHGLELVHWSIDTHDWRGDSPRDMLGAAAERLQDGAIVLMHDGLGPGSLRAGCENTLALLAPLCSLAAERGLSAAPPTTLSTLPVAVALVPGMSAEL
jgi:peptidoglycan/xylan/chitin deacetylase (PgdA/CDA1 family)